MNRPAVRDTALLLLRAVLGLVFVAHGVDKMFFAGIDETTGQFSAMGIPQPHVSAYIAALGEMIGGSLLVVGLLTTFVAGALALFMADGGFEYPAVLIASLVMIVVFGSGRVSLDGVLSRVDA